MLCCTKKTPQDLVVLSVLVYNHLTLTKTKTSTGNGIAETDKLILCKGLERLTSFNT